MVKNSIDAFDYILIAIGIILLPFYLIGMIFLGMAVFRIGNKMANHKEETDRRLDEFDKQTEWEIRELEGKYRKENADYLDPQKVGRWV